MSANKSKSVTFDQMKSHQDLTAGGLTYSVSQTDTVVDVSTAAVWGSVRSPAQTWHTAKSHSSTRRAAQLDTDIQQGDSRDKALPSPLRKIKEIVKMNAESPESQSRLEKTKPCGSSLKYIQQKLTPTDHTPPTLVIQSRTPPQHTMAKLTGVKFKIRQERVNTSDNSLQVSSLQCCNTTQVPQILQTDNRCQTHVTVKDARTDISAALLKKSAIPISTRVKSANKAKSSATLPPMRCGRFHHSITAIFPSQSQSATPKTHTATKKGDNSKTKKISTTVGLTNVTSPKAKRKSLSEDVTVQNSKPVVTKPAAVNKKSGYTKSIQSRIGSFDNIHYKPSGGKKTIYGYKLKFKEQAKSKIGSLDNINYKPGGDNLSNSKEKTRSLLMEKTKGTAQRFRINITTLSYNDEAIIEYDAGIYWKWNVRMGHVNQYSIISGFNSLDLKLSELLLQDLSQFPSYCIMSYLYWYIRDYASCVQ